jgi:2-polyprenyl-3-methyl-5-hydroxy-6-metoxy-1,4-benzoquinol methylase
VDKRGDRPLTFRPIRTYSAEWLNRHRATHAKHAVFGTHRHPYLLDTLRRLAAAVATEGGEAPSLLDYGCGKGVFMREMTGTKLFRYIRGYDPAVDAFKARPAQLYDIVVCLDVLDQLEDEFVEPAVSDVTQFSGRIALFDVITRQTPALAHLNPRTAQSWREIIDRYMRVDEMVIRTATPDEIAQGACPERVIITAAPRGAGQPA